MNNKDMPDNTLDALQDAYDLWVELFGEPVCEWCGGTGFCDGPGDAHPSTKTPCVACDLPEEAALAELERRNDTSLPR